MLALVTCAAARSIDTDLPLLTAELPEAEIVVWDDPGVAWERYAAVVIRSAWDYHERRDEFVAWTRRVARRTRLWNPLEVIEWNTDKHYLDRLAADGVPTVPTWFVGPDAAGEPLDDLDGLEPDADLVVKPSIGAGSNGVIRSHGDRRLVERHVRELHAGGRTAMLQRYVTDVDEQGETGLVYLGGSFSHAFGKAAILSGPVSWEGGLFAEERVEPRRATAEQRAIGDLIIRALPPTAYARIDLLPGPSGPIVLEVELTEPSLYLECDPDAPARAASVFRSLAA